MVRKYMHLESGDVQTEAGWKSDFDSMDHESWGYPECYDGDFSDWIEVGHLVEVMFLGGEWVEA